MRWVIKSDAESGDGVSIEREQPSIVFRSMPHFTDFGSAYLSALPADDQSKVEVATPEIAGQSFSELQSYINRMPENEYSNNSFSRMAPGMRIPVSQGIVEDERISDLDTPESLIPENGSYIEVSLPEVNINDEVIGFSPSELESIHSRGTTHEYGSNNTHYFDHIYDQSTTMQGIDDILYGIIDSMINDHHQGSSYEGDWDYGKVIPGLPGGQKWHKHDSGLGWNIFSTGDENPDESSEWSQTYTSDYEGNVFAAKAIPGNDCWTMPDLHLASSMMLEQSNENYQSELIAGNMFINSYQQSTHTQNNFF